ncbi:MAG: signal peptidase I [Clostridia bacterium]|nr:signal peptidase I [Clostridia bacterium]
MEQDKDVVLNEQQESVEETVEQTVETVEEDQSKPKNFKERIAFSVYDVASIIGTAILAIMLVFTFGFRFVGVVGPSMQPTLFENDWLAVTATLKNPEAGDIVIITQPNAFNEPIVKRVIATEGQTVDIRDGHVYLDGELLVEKYISPDVVTQREDLDNYPVTVPEGQVFVLGDNRPHSSDSRSSAIGLIDNDYIIGKVSFRLMPFGKWDVNIEYDY